MKTLLAFIVFSVAFLGQASAQSVGQSCSTSGWLSILPNQILYCNGSTWALGEEITSSGYVGIGTASPASSLDLSQKTDAIILPSGTLGQRPSSPVNGMVRYNSSTSPTLEAYVNGSWVAFGSSGGSSTVTFGTSASSTNPEVAGDATTGLFSPTSSTVALSTGGTERLRIDSSGNVGIGTTSPSALLHIQGAPYTSDTALPSQVIVRSNAAYNSSPITGMNFGFQYDSSGDYAGEGGIGVGKENATSGNAASYLALFTRPAGGQISEQMRITSAGYVGIGTSTPSNKLDVRGNADFITGSGYLTLKFGSGYLNEFLQNNFGSFSLSNNASLGSFWAYDSYGQANQIIQNANSGISFNATSSTGYAGNGITWTTVMQILNSGNVGIGTTSPQAPLHVAGEVIVGSTGLACSSTTAGALQYASGVLQYCNGSAWTTINSAAAGGITPGCGTSGTISSQTQTTINVAVGCHIIFKVWGGGGGSGGYGYAGGGGGYATITLGPLSSATTYYLVVGGGGLQQGNGGFGGAGATGFTGGSGVTGVSYPGGGGAAASGVWTGGYGSSGTAVVVAAGGGGTGGTGSVLSTNAGGTGGPQNSSSTGGSAASDGGTNSSAGGGGGGYTTGGSAGIAASDGGGNGGSNYAATGGGTTAGSGSTPGNAGDTNYPANAGAGAASHDGYAGAIYYSTY